MPEAITVKQQAQTQNFLKSAKVKKKSEIKVYERPQIVTLMFKILERTQVHNHCVDIETAVKRLLLFSYVKWLNFQISIVRATISHCFIHFLFVPLVWWQGFLPQNYKDGQNMTANSGQMRPTVSQSYNHSLGRRALHAMQGYKGFVLRNKVNNQGLRESGFVVSRG